MVKKNGKMIKGYDKMARLQNGKMITTFSSLLMITYAVNTTFHHC